MSEAVHDAQRLMELQALPLERKIQITQARIIEWYQHYHGNVVVSFSGGKDSTVLLHLVRQLYDELRYFFLEHYESDQLGQFTCDVLNAIMRLHGD